MRSKIRSFKFRIYPSKKQEKLLNNHLRLAKDLWNELLACNKQFYNDFGYFLSKNTMQLMVKGHGLFSQTQQEISHRVFEAVMRVFRMRKKGKKCGFPRFKNFDRMKSINYPQYTAGFWLGEKLKVTPFGEIKIKRHRETKGKIKTLTLKKEPTGKWFAVFCAEVEKPVPKQNNGEQVGIDLGLMKFAALSNGTVINNPRHLKRYEEKLAFRQRKLSKKKKRSNSKRKARLKTARVYEKVRNTRADFLHKTTIKLVSTYSVIALEELASQEMAERQFGKSINDAGWDKFANMLAYKAEGAGCNVIFINPKNTTKMCSNCGELVDKHLWDRQHNCPYCGLSMDRDLNAARNILKRATAGQAGSNACGDETIVSSLKQEAHTF